MGGAQTNVRAHLARVRERIRAAEEAADREPGGVALLAVSKRQSVEKIRAAYAAGQILFGESYLQEAIQKMDQLADLPLEWHFIGRIQSNKTRPIAERFAWVHSLADARHAQRLSTQRPASLPPLKVCIQVNLSGEASKAGVVPGQVAELLATCTELPNMLIAGLMTLPAPATGQEAQRLPFRALRRLRDELTTATGLALHELSMGMSDDLEAAIFEGATMVRVGTAVFGPRM
jgi:pyridoxal phosphate enzyme (YggS family)